MVNVVMTVSALKKVREQMKLIQGEGFEWFVADVISWYQTDLINTHILHRNEYPPNIFRMKEYTNEFSEMIDVYAHFGKHRDSVEADHDVVSILNAYHLFYCYRDDAHPYTRYYNHFSKEVW